MSLVLSIIMVWILQTSGWLLSMFKKKQHIVDVFWGQGILLVTLCALFWSGFQSVPLVVVTILTAVWGIRLSYTIYQRNKGKDEDRRYQEIMKDFKNIPLETYLKIWMLQGGLMILLGMSALSLSAHQGLGSLNMLILGLLVWGVGFYFEHTGDKQLNTFKSKPENKGKLMTEGLWAYTRHPNYFGEVVMWWGIWMIAAGSIGFWALLALISPITITILILKISGVPMAEKHYDTQDREDWKKYKASTNKFFPWFKRT